MNATAHQPIPMRRSPSGANAFGVALGDQRRDKAGDRAARLPLSASMRKRAHWGRELFLTCLEVWAYRRDLEKQSAEHSGDIKCGSDFPCVINFIYGYSFPL